MNNKGLSGIVTIIIIIALALVAVGIVWYVINNVLESGRTEALQASSDVFANCPTANVTDQNDSETICGASEEIRILGGQYCCVAP